MRFHNRCCCFLSSLHGLNLFFKPGIELLEIFFVDFLGRHEFGNRFANVQLQVTLANGAMARFITAEVIFVGTAIGIRFVELCVGPVLEEELAADELADRFPVAKERFAELAILAGRGGKFV